MKDFLQVRKLAIGYKGKRIAENVDLRLNGGVTALIGRNGVGKSTLIKTLTGNLKPLEGEIEICGKPLGEYDLKALSKTVSLVATDFNQAGGLRLHELVALGRIPYTGKFGKLDKNDKDKIEAAIEKVGLTHKKDAFVAELSDGERQKGNIARGLVQETPLIIMDEPFSFLDVASRLEMMEIMRELTDSEKMTILYSTHEVTEALKSADRIWLMSRGEVKEGSPTEIIDSGAIEMLFDNPRIKFDIEKESFYLENK